MSSPVSIYVPTDSPAVQFAVNALTASLRDRGREVHHRDVSQFSGDETGASVTVIDSPEQADTLGEVETGVDELDEEGFRIQLKIDNGEPSVLVAGGDETGAMYGLLDVDEQLSLGRNLDTIADRMVTRDVSFRAVKFNLPWSPYRAGEHNDLQLDTCRDLDFWEAFLDMMARNRFNVLSLWNLHPFAFMVRSESFPEACPFDDDELADWQEFWHSLFGMAADRGIDVYLVNWNIVVSPEFAEAYDVAEHGSTAEVVKEYTREVVTQTINEYENLTGLGVTLADWMEGMSATEKQDWLQDTIIEGIKRADRQVDFIDRSVLTESIDEMRRVIDDASAHENFGRIVVPSKFNWSHGHSTTNLELTHDYSTGEVDDRLWDPEPTNYDLTWMVRNEDFFVLRWGDPEFIREHIAQNAAGKDYVGGYFVGSEGFIPAQDYSHRTHKHKTWQYAFEKQWLLYMLWGRLLYDSETPDEVFANAFDQRYGVGVGEKLLEAYSLGSRMPLALASFHAGTWDYTLYSEGFLAPEPTPFAMEERREAETCGEAKAVAEAMPSSFISVDDLIYHEPLDSELVSIPAFVDAQLAGETTEQRTPDDLATEMTENGRRALELVEDITEDMPELTVVDGFHLDTHTETYVGALGCELADVATWAYLSLYFAEKLRAGIALTTFRQTSQSSWKAAAINRLEQAADYWDEVVDLTEDHYRETPYRKDETFSWAAYQQATRQDVELAERSKATSRFDWSNLKR